MNTAEIVHFLPLYEYNLNKMQRRYKVNQVQQVKLRRNEQRKAKDQAALYEQYFLHARPGNYQMGDSKEA